MFYSCVAVCFCRDDELIKFFPLNLSYFSSHHKAHIFSPTALHIAKCFPFLSPNIYFPFPHPSTQHLHFCLRFALHILPIFEYFITNQFLCLCLADFHFVLCLSILLFLFPLAPRHGINSILVFSVASTSVSIPFTFMVFSFHLFSLFLH